MSAKLFLSVMVFAPILRLLLAKTIPPMGIQRHRPKGGDLCRAWMPRPSSMYSHPLRFREDILRNCLNIPDRYYSGVRRVVETEPKSLFCRLGCHQTRTLKSLLAIFQSCCSHRSPSMVLCVPGFSQYPPVRVSLTSQRGPSLAWRLKDILWSIRSSSPCVLGPGISLLLKGRASRALARKKWLQCTPIRYRAISIT